MPPPCVRNAVYRPCEQLSQPAQDAEELVLVSGAVAYDAGNLFRLTTVMRSLACGAVVGLNPADVERMSLDAQTPVTVQSANGALALTVQVDERVQPGTAWIPESLPGAPVGALQNGRDVEYVRITTRN